MSQPLDDELLSAYLDGELRGEELVRVEQMLAERPEAQQLLDELRALGSSVRSLPRHALEEDFADRVLRRAEREVLSGQPLPRQRPDCIPVDSRFEPPKLLSWARWQRPLAWSGLAVAAALLVMFVTRPMEERLDRDNVAMAPTTESPKLAPPETLPPRGNASQHLPDSGLKMESAEFVAGEPKSAEPKAAVADHVVADQVEGFDATTRARRGADAKLTELDASTDEPENLRHYFRYAKEIAAEGAKMDPPLAASDVLVFRCRVPSIESGQQALLDLFAQQKIEYHDELERKDVADARAKPADKGDTELADQLASSPETAPVDAVLVAAPEERLKSLIAAVEKNPQMFQEAKFATWKAESAVPETGRAATNKAASEPVLRMQRGGERPLDESVQQVAPPSPAQVTTPEARDGETRSYGQARRLRLRDGPVADVESLEDRSAEGSPGRRQMTPAAPNSAPEPKAAQVPTPAPAPAAPAPAGISGEGEATRSKRAASSAKGTPTEMKERKPSEPPAALKAEEQDAPPPPAAMKRPTNPSKAASQKALPPAPPTNAKKGAADKAGSRFGAVPLGMAKQSPRAVLFVFEVEPAASQGANEALLPAGKAD